MNNFDELAWIRDVIDGGLDRYGADVAIVLLCLFNIILMVTR